MKFRLLKIIFLVALVSLPPTLAAQTKKNTRPKKPAAAVPATPQPTPESVSETATKKNERPTDAKPAGSSGKNLQVYTPVYFYQFDRPGFVTPRVLIEHDTSGKGKISFSRNDTDEMLSDPIQLSTATLGGINEAFVRLNFIDATESYQYEKELPQMGKVEIKLKKDGRERTVTFNWTVNKDARFLMDEYRRVGNEYLWKFDMAVARENQPLQTPGMVDALDSYLTRNEISDPPHLVPYLTELAKDERLPLLARNHVSRLIKQIEKQKQ